MKGAIMSLLLVCLLVAMPVTAAAFEPTNCPALGATLQETKIIVKEEVVRSYGTIINAYDASENVAFLVEPKPVLCDSCGILGLLPCDEQTKYVDGLILESESLRCGCRVCSRFT